MTIDKAIKMLTIAMPEQRTSTNADYHDAIKLGIEALKRIKVHRENSIPGPMFILPGETKT